MPNKNLSLRGLKNNQKKCHPELVSGSQRACRIHNSEIPDQVRNDKRAPVFIALGSNIGDRAGYLSAALRGLDTLGELIAASSIYETEPLGPSVQPFLNQVISLQTELSPQDLLRQLKHIEKKLGRKARGHWAAREIDLDILLFGSVSMWQPDLQIPHAELAHRRFVLAPLTEIAPELSHPALGLSMRELLNCCPDSLSVKKWKI